MNSNTMLMLLIVGLLITLIMLLSGFAGLIFLIGVAVGIFIYDRFQVEVVKVLSKFKKGG
jgi:hypothetical protein